MTRWDQSFAYDGFGNLTDQTTIKGTAPELHVTFNESTNHQTGSSPDANGSTATYDEENRLASSGCVYSTLAYYSYGPANKRVSREDLDLGPEPISIRSGRRQVDSAVQRLQSNGYLH